jgi:hypothetical protein
LELVVASAIQVGGALVIQISLPLRVPTAHGKA